MARSLAERRREALAALIRSAPAQALRRAVPDAVRVRLPQAIADRLELPVCGRGDFEVRIPFPAQGERAEVLRFVTLAGRRYRAFVYGRRARQPSKFDVPLHGIAVDDLLSLHESPLQIGETETPPGTRGEEASAQTRRVAVRVGGASRVVESHAQALDTARWTARCTRWRPPSRSP